MNTCTCLQGAKSTRPTRDASANTHASCKSHNSHGDCCSTNSAVLPRYQNKNTRLGSGRSTSPDLDDHAEAQSHEGQRSVVNRTQLQATSTSCKSPASDDMGLAGEEMQRALGAFTESRLQQYNLKLQAAAEARYLVKGAGTVTADAEPLSGTEDSNVLTDSETNGCGGGREEISCPAGAQCDKAEAQKRDRDAELREDNAWMDQYRREAVQRWVDMHLLPAGM